MTAQRASSTTTPSTIKPIRPMSSSPRSSCVHRAGGGGGKGSPSIGELGVEAALREGVEDEIFSIPDILDADRRVPMAGEPAMGRGRGSQANVSTPTGGGARIPL